MDRNLLETMLNDDDEMMVTKPRRADKTPDDEVDDLDTVIEATREAIRRILLDKNADQKTAA